MKAMILAAGRGERMKPLTDETAKPLLSVGGKSLIQYHLENLAAIGIREIVINLAWKGALIRDALGDGGRFGVRITYSDEGDAALETGGGVFKALPLLGPGPFVVISGDVWTDYPLERLTRVPQDRDVAHFVVVPNPDFHTRGDFALADGRLVRDGEKFTYGNLGVFRPEFFEACAPGRFALAPIMFDWIDRGRVSGELYEGRWHNVGTPAQLAELDAQLRSV
ncbi:MurNAc alpha-1-phosphate uridylyltransferase [Povalibacter uvarum]|uniref:MurNAc alpha-1-phosphate uridylyltransferase n=1 Tax=Povalibacter uvarum TaxID=732238 RepID=A0A841HQ69_9GAMM|nr:nucleotidyltransferase family protein [Povalibacter uvarum]MBB6094380.1 MurNAc alpha-1-phosphate uridylyltransferase [Povalibacter uvarum]